MSGCRNLSASLQKEPLLQSGCWERCTKIASGAHSSWHILMLTVKVTLEKIKSEGKRQREKARENSQWPVGRDGGLQVSSHPKASLQCSWVSPQHSLVVETQASCSNSCRWFLTICSYLWLADWGWCCILTATLGESVLFDLQGTPKTQKRWK